MQHYVKSSNETLRKRGYRLTPQRYMILSVIQEADGHLSIDQIAERVQKRNPYVSLSTIYRTLELLKELGLYVKITCQENNLTMRWSRAMRTITWFVETAARLSTWMMPCWAIYTNDYRSNTTTTT